jgi:hypothetical protein
MKKSIVLTLFLLLLAVAAAAHIIAMDSGVWYGPELLTNGDFSAWTGDDPDGWAVSGTEDAGSYVTENPAGSCQIISDGDFMAIQQDPGWVAGKKYKIVIITAAVATNQIALSEVGESGIGVVTAAGKYTFEHTVVSGGLFRIYRDGAVATNAIIASLSVREIN